MLRLYKTDKWPVKEILKDLRNWKTKKKIQAGYEKWIWYYGDNEKHQK